MVGFQKDKLNRVSLPAFVCAGFVAGLNSQFFLELGIRVISFLHYFFFFFRILCFPCSVLNMLS